MSPPVVAAGNPTLAPLAVGLGLFVLLLVGLGVAMLRTNGRQLGRQRARTSSERTKLRRSLIVNGVATSVAVAAFVALAAHQLLVAAILAAVALAWRVLGRQQVKPH